MNKKISYTIFKVLIVVILLSFTESGKKIVNNIINNLYNTFRFITGGNLVPDLKIMITLKYSLYTFSIIYCLVYFFLICYKKYTKQREQLTEENDYEDLKKYINNENISFIFIDGPWGIGKTYYVKKGLEYHNLEYYYISLFGLKSRDQIIKEIINEVKSKSWLNGLLEVPLIRTIINIITSLDGLNILQSSNKRIIVFDDLERVSGIVHNNEYKAKFEDYNDIIGFIEYFSQNYKEYTCIVIMDEKKMQDVFNLLIQPKLKPQIITLPFYESKVRQISKKYLIDKTETFIDIYTKIWIARRNINKIEQWTYRPMVKELEVLSKVNDEKIIIDIALSEFVDLFNLNNTTKCIGCSISSYFSIMQQNSTNQELKIINDLVNYKNMKHIIANANYQSIVNL